MNEEDDDGECPGCGSTPANREEHSPGKITLRRCPHCGSEKCCMCDAGDDVECISCGE